ncbi:hypothetical protein VM98_38200, partial [Streptomyces rubellomurinus subsp. indigoferus]
RALADQHVGITASRSSGGSSLWSTLLLFLPLLSFGGLFLWSGRMPARSRSGGLSALRRFCAKIIEDERPDTPFAAVARYDGVKQDVSEVVDFLLSPDRHAAADP